MASIETEREDIQGNILRAYGFHHAHFHFSRIVDAAGARALLHGLVKDRRVTTAALWDDSSKPDTTLNVFFSWSGLGAIGLPQPALDSFPEEFRQGMTGRRRQLGDPDPQDWDFGADPAAMHILFAIQGRTASDCVRMTASLDEEIRRSGPSVELAHLEVGVLTDDRREHFGFADGFGQPAIEGSGAPEFRGDGTPAADDAWNPIKAGEFVLGWANETGRQGPMPSPRELGHNGSYLVFRKLEQDVAAFRKFLRDQALRLYGSDEQASIELLAAKLVGRWRSGCPIMLSPEADDQTLAGDWSRNNDFRYASDPRGALCPIGAHVRRMNPRDGLTGDGDLLVRTHRIVRRGLPYGEPLLGDVDDGKERGVLFMAINASIAYQFETVQTEWTNSGEFAHLDREDVDVFSGEPREGSRFRIPHPTQRSARIWNLPHFVTLRGGGYFFIPGITALRFIAGPQN